MCGDTSSNTSSTDSSGGWGLSNNTNYGYADVNNIGNYNDLSDPSNLGSTEGGVESGSLSDRLLGVARYASTGFSLGGVPGAVLGGFVGGFIGYTGKAAQFGVTTADNLAETTTSGDGSGWSQVKTFGTESEAQSYADEMQALYDDEQAAAADAEDAAAAEAADTASKAALAASMNDQIATSWLGAADTNAVTRKTLLGA